MYIKPSLSERAKAPVHMGIRHRARLLAPQVMEDHHWLPLHEVLVGQHVAVLGTFRLPSSFTILGPSQMQRRMELIHMEIPMEISGTCENVRKIICKLRI